MVKLNAVCMQCYKEAAYTKRIGDEKEVRRQTSRTKWTQHKRLYVTFTEGSLEDLTEKLEHLHTVIALLPES